MLCYLARSRSLEKLVHFRAGRDSDSLQADRTTEQVQAESDWKAVLPCRAALFDKETSDIPVPERTK